MTTIFRHATAKTLMRKLSGLLVAIAMLAVLPAGTISANAADETPQEYLQLTLTRTDSNGTPAEVGDKLTSAFLSGHPPA